MKKNEKILYLQLNSKFKFLFRKLTVGLEGETRRGFLALSQLPNLRELYFCSINEVDNRRLQLECLQLLPKLQRADNYYPDSTSHNSLFTATPVRTVQLEHVSLRHWLPDAPVSSHLMSSVRSLRLLQPRFSCPPAAFLAVFDRVSELHVSGLDGVLLRQVLSAIGRQLSKLTLQEVQCDSLANDVLQQCPRLQEFHSSFSSYGPTVRTGPVACLQQLEMQIEADTFPDGGAVLQLLRAPLLQHLHFFGLNLRLDETRTLVRMVQDGSILRNLQTLAVFDRKLNLHGRLLVDNIIVHCPSIRKCLSY